jgi:hypothetical protein
MATVGCQNNSAPHFLVGPGFMNISVFAPPRFAIARVIHYRFE